MFGENSMRPILFRHNSNPCVSGCWMSKCVIPLLGVVLTVNTRSGRSSPTCAKCYCSVYPNSKCKINMVRLFFFLNVSRIAMCPRHNIVRCRSEFGTEVGMSQRVYLVTKTEDGPQRIKSWWMPIYNVMYCPPAYYDLMRRNSPENSVNDWL